MRAEKSHIRDFFIPGIILRSNSLKEIRLTVLINVPVLKLLLPAETGVLDMDVIKVIYVKATKISGGHHAVIVFGQFTCHSGQ